jgi:signal transduction histidine kinase
VIFDEVKRPMNYRFLEVNPAFEKQTGFKNAQGRLVRDLVPKLEQHWFDTYGKIAMTGEPARFQNMAAELGRWFDVYAFRIGEPEARQVAVLFTDITGQKRHGEKLEKAVAERTAALSATVAELEGVSYSLSHDMRAPLRTIHSFSEIVLQQAKEKIAPREQDLLQKVINSAGRMDRLIQDVLTYSRVAREAISLQPLNVENLIRQIVEERPELQPPIARIEIDGPLPPVRGHEAYMTQCITNLLHNAVKFVPPGRQPQVRIWAEPGPSTHSSIERSIHSIPPGFVRLWFEDNGIGIPAEAQQRIFEIFQRVHDNSTYSGTGIGLAIVRKAAERMGGSAGVQSEQGHGSRFWLQLPRA